MINDTVIAIELVLEACFVRMQTSAHDSDPDCEIRLLGFPWIFKPGARVPRATLLGGGVCRVAALCAIHLEHVFPG